MLLQLLLRFYGPIRLGRICCCCCCSVAGRTGVPWTVLLHGVLLLLLLLAVLLLLLLLLLLQRRHSFLLQERGYKDKNLKQKYISMGGPLIHDRPPFKTTKRDSSSSR